MTAVNELDTRSAWAEDTRAAAMVWRRELLRFWRARGRVAASLVQPLLLLVVLGVGLGPMVGGTREFTSFLFPGVVAMTVATTAVMSATSIVWDREFGFLREMLVAPVSRVALLLGKAAGGITVAVAQGCLVLMLAPVMGVRLSVSVLASMIGIMTLEAFAMCTFGMVLASLVKRLESFNVIMQLLLMPLLFLSGALFPLDRLPSWMTALVAVNPLTYAVDPLRRVLLPSQPGALDLFGRTPSIALELGGLLACGVVLLIVAGRFFGRAD